QRAANIVHGAEAGYARSQIPALDSHRRDTHEDNRDTREQLISVIDSKLKGRIDVGHHQIKLLSAIVTAQRRNGAVLKGWVSEPQRFKVFNVKVHWCADPGTQ